MKSNIPKPALRLILASLLLWSALIALCSCGSTKQPMKRDYVIGEGFVGKWEPVSFKKGDTIHFTKDLKLKP